MGKTQGMIAQIESDEELQEHCTRKFEDEGVVIEVYYGIQGHKGQKLYHW